TVMALVVALSTPLAETWSVQPEAALVRVRSEKVATPWLAVTVSMPPSVAPPGLLASDTVTVPLKEESRLPELSSASTVRPKELPAATLAGGCWVTTKRSLFRVTSPIELFQPSLNQRFPSGPTVITPGWELA